MFRLFVAILTLFAATGCKAPFSTDQSSASHDGFGRDEIVENVFAPSTPEHPRNSEGDLIVLKDGTYLAAWSDFTGGRGDHATASISAVTSRDGGRTWSQPYLLQENIGKQNVMSCSFLRLPSDEILFFFLVKNSLADLKVYVRRSSDEARTWTKPVVVTPEPGYHIMNNARVIRLKSGRILCPVSFTPDIGIRGGAHLRNVCYFSDDNGHTWKRGEGIVDCPKRGAMEPHVIELKDGRILQIIRTQMGQIWRAYSSDQGNTWTEAEPMGIVSPESPSTIARIPRTGELLLIWNPSIERGITGPDKRTPLACALSRDEGKTWSEPKLIESDLTQNYVYVSITFHKDRVLLTYFVRPNGTHELSQKFKSIPIAWF